MATDLTRADFRAIGGEPIVRVTEATLAAGASMVETWRELEPIVKKLTKKVRDYVESEAVTAVQAAKLLGLSASVVQKVGAAAQGMLRATEGQAKLAILLSAGRPQQRNPTELTEKQLSAVVLETAKRIWTSGQPCPVCHATHPVEVPADA